MWRVLYPCGIHFLLSQLVANAGLFAVLKLMGGTMEDFTGYTVVLTGITALLTMVPCIFFYRRDRILRIAGGLTPPEPGRRLSAADGILLLLMGAACAVYANMLVAPFGNVLKIQEYQDTMNRITNGKSLFMLIFWMGLVAPAAEEMVFRWLIYLRLRDYMRMGTAALISGIFFGLYHMNLLQAVYAGILGVIFACFLEITGSLWSSILLHMGANICSLLMPELVLKCSGAAGILLMDAVLLVILTVGTLYLRQKAVTQRSI